MYLSYSLRSSIFHLAGISCLHICKFVFLILKMVCTCACFFLMQYLMCLFGVHIEFCMEYLLLCIIFTALIRAVLSYSSTASSCCWSYSRLHHRHFWKNIDQLPLSFSFSFFFCCCFSLIFFLHIYVKEDVAKFIS